jgi:hypothetical protein
LTHCLPLERSAEAIRPLTDRKAHGKIVVVPEALWGEPKRGDCRCILTGAGDRAFNGDCAGGGLELLHYALIENSEGGGRHRGDLSLRRDYSSLEDLRAASQQEDRCLPAPSPVPAVLPRGEAPQSDQARPEEQQEVSASEPLLVP